MGGSLEGLIYLRFRGLGFWVEGTGSPSRAFSLWAAIENYLYYVGGSLV